VNQLGLQWALRGCEKEWTMGGENGTKENGLVGANRAVELRCAECLSDMVVYKETGIKKQGSYTFREPKW